MADHVIYIDRFQLREGRAEEFRRYAADMTDLVKKNEPGALSFNFFMDETGLSGTAVFVFSDPESLDAHLELASSRFQEGYELLSATEIELLRRPSDRAAEMARSFNAGLKTKLAGFSR